MLRLMCHCGENLKIAPRHYGRSIRCRNCRSIVSVSTGGHSGVTVDSTDIIERRVNVFVSYRRNDSRSFTDRLVTRLKRTYGYDHVFQDIDSIPPGVDFRNEILQGIEGCDALLAIIGPDWMGTDAHGNRRIDSKKDYIRFEIATALGTQVPTIPVLINTTPMLIASELPRELSDLVHINACRIVDGADFDEHVNRLVAAIDRVAGGKVSTQQRQTIVRIIEGPGVGSTFDLRKSVVEIGGASHCDIQAPGVKQSVRLSKRRGRYVLCAGDKTGVLVNGERVIETYVMLNDGDELKVGDSSLLLSTK